MSMDEPRGLRRAAVHAVELARRTSDLKMRAALLNLAAKWAAQAEEAAEAQRRLDAALQEFNVRQMFGPRATWQRAN